MEHKIIRTVNDLEVFGLSFKLAMDIFHLSSKFPKEELYSLTDQIRRSSRSVTVNISEGWGKRKYSKNFKRHLVDANGSLEETKTWLLFAFECGYIVENELQKLIKQSELLGGKLWRLEERWQ